MKKDDGKDYNSGAGIAVVSNKEHKVKPFLGHLSYTYEYRVDIEVSMNNEMNYGTMADFETTSRAIAESQVIWFLAGVILTFVVGFLTKFL